MTVEEIKGEPVCPLSQWGGVGFAAGLSDPITSLTIRSQQQQQQQQVRTKQSHRRPAREQNLKLSSLHPTTPSDTELQICLCGPSETNRLKLQSSVVRPNFLFQKPSVWVNARCQQEAVAFPESLLSARRLQPLRDGRRFCRDYHTEMWLLQFTAGRSIRGI